MAGDTRGTDFVSWWKNRGAYRADIASTASKLRSLQAKLAAAAGDAPPKVPAASDSLADLTQKAETTLNSLAEARGKIPKFGPAIESERASTKAKIAGIQSAAAERIRRAEKLKQQAELNVARLAEKRKQNMKKLTAAVLALAILILVIVF